MRLRSAVLISGTAVLFAAIGVNLRPKIGVQSFSAIHPLSVLAPKAPPGWTVKDTPLGPTEISVGDTLRTLNLSDYFFKTYHQGNMDVRVYVAYWSPGKLDSRRVWSHRPETCWVANGAIMLLGNDRRVLDGGTAARLMPASYGIFQFPQGREEEVFWHLVGGKLSGFESENTSLISKWRHFENSLSLTGFGVAPKEQIVVRISTNRTIDDVIHCELWPFLLMSLSSSGIVDRDEPSHEG